MSKKLGDRATERRFHAAFRNMLESKPDPGAAPGVNCSGKAWDEFQDCREEMLERGLLVPVTRTGSKKPHRIRERIDYRCRRFRVSPSMQTQNR
jgi:hypothetical protein